jgi:tetratricopeptide (TPR) repeat protein
MDNDDGQRPYTSGKALNWILAVVTALVACSVAWVGWICIDSVQKHEGKLHDFHVTADNTKIDSHRYDVVKNEIDSQVFTDKLSPSEDLQAALVKREGSELIYSQGIAAIDKKQFAQAAAYYSQILTMIPAEAKTKTTWYASGATGDRSTYTMWVYHQRALCYRNMGDYSRAVADWTVAIKLHPDNAYNYQKRAELYYAEGKKTFGDSDTKTAQVLLNGYRRRH